MMKTIILFLFAIITLAACTKKSQPMPETPYTPPPQVTVPITGTLSYLALGDSYTIGQSVSAKESFPYQLTTQVPGKLITTPYIIAVTGWTTDNLIYAINQDTNVKGKTYDIVTLLIGVNDQYQGMSQANYRIKFVQLLNTAIQFAGGNKNHVFVLSIPDYGVTPFANGNDSKIGPEIDQFNTINHEETAKANVTYVDITPISKQAANDLSLIAGDGLHPSAKMYKLWVDKLAPEVYREFNK